VAAMNPLSIAKCRAGPMGQQNCGRCQGTPEARRPASGTAKSVGGTIQS